MCIILMQLSSRKIKNLGVDVTDTVFSKFKRLRNLKAYKSSIVTSLKKNKRKKYLTNKLNFLLGSVSNRNLNFKSKNSRNVFLRTKRKSSYGQTLIEKQKLQDYNPYLSRFIFKKYFSLYKEKFLEKTEFFPQQILNRLNLFVSASSINRLFLGKKNLVVPSEPNFYLEYDMLKINHLSIPKLRYTKEKKNLKSIVLYDRPLSNNFVLDLRLQKIKILPLAQRVAYPFKMEQRKVLQHFRLKRS